MSELGPAWCVRRTDGLLVPGFTKRFDADRSRGTTYFFGVPIGAFDVEQVDGGGVELRYRWWPVVDALAQPPADGDSIRSTGYVRIGRAQARFCRFRLER